MKTALQQAIDACNELANKSHYAKMCVDIMKELLPTERQIIEEAYGDGYNQGNLSSNLTPDYDSPTDYYNQIFNNQNDNDAN